MRTRVIKIAIATAVAGAALWAGAGVALAGGGCHSPSTAGRGHTIDIVDLCFVSTVLYVSPGTEVTWTNQDPIEHDVVGVGDSWGDPGVSLSLGDDVTYRFDEDGVYPYACWFHPGMVGAIVVGDGVGTGLTAAVATSGGDQGSAETASAGLAENGGDATAIWIVGTALVVGALAGAFVVAMRNRRKVSVAG